MLSLPYPCVVVTKEFLQKMWYPKGVFSCWALSSIRHILWTILQSAFVAFTSQCFIEQKETSMHSTAYVTLGNLCGDLSHNILLQHELHKTLHSITYPAKRNIGLRLCTMWHEIFAGVQFRRLTIFGGNFREFGFQNLNCWEQIFCGS